MILRFRYETWVVLRFMMCMWGKLIFISILTFFKDSKYQVPAELERTVLQYCISFNTTLRTEHHGIHEIRLRTGKQFCIITKFSVEHIINRIKLEASSCCSVCCHRDGYGSCKRAEYGQNWSYGDVQECEGFAREQNAYRSNVPVSVYLRSQLRCIGYCTRRTENRARCTSECSS